MPRLFTGLTIPENLRLHLSSLRGGLPGARWIDNENYHITLRFVGDVDDRTAEEIDAMLVRVARPSFKLQLFGVGSFGSKRPHSVWAGVSQAPELTDLQSELERRMQRIGLVPDSRKYTPHVTLARVRGASRGAVANWLATRADFASQIFDVGEFVLFSSKAMKGGGPYLVEETYPLVA